MSLVYIYVDLHPQLLDMTTAYHTRVGVEYMVSDRRPSKAVRMADLKLMWDEGPLINLTNEPQPKNKEDAHTDSIYII